MAPILWKFDNIILDYSPYTAVAICILLALAYVGSLYVWTSTKKSRDHPETIKLRFVRVTIVCALVVPFLWLCGTKSHSVKARILFTWLGLRFKGFITATILPLILTMVLFMGPLSLHYLDGIFRIYRDPQYWLSNFKNLIWLRNHVVAPIAEEYVFRAAMLPFLVPHFGEMHSILICPFFFSAPISEEFIFRACMLPILVPSFGETWSIVVCPLVFGIAHLHHLHEKLREGVDMKIALINSLIQFSFTSVFGAYSAFIFLRTDHLVAPVIVHAFCNHMGLPNFQEVLAHSAPKRYYIMISFMVGLLLWSQLLFPFTNPSLYSNDLYFSS